MASNESEAGRPSRKGKASLRATEASFQITDSPASASRQEKKKDGGCPRHSAAAAAESLSFADAVERRQADIVRLDGEEEGCADKISPIAQALKTCADELSPTRYSSSLENMCK